jgi:hypothetical protein
MNGFGRVAGSVFRGRVNSSPTRLGSGWVGQVEGGYEVADRHRRKWRVAAAGVADGGAQWLYGGYLSFTPYSGG